MTAYGVVVDVLTELTFPGGGTTTLHVARSVSESDPMALVLPAMGVPAAFYGPLLDGLAANGVTAVVADFPGQGGSRPLLLATTTTATPRWRRSSSPACSRRPEPSSDTG